MIQPDQIPRIQSDLDVLVLHGQALKTQAQQFADTGLDVHTTWQGLAAFYRAPEAAGLLAATAPVKTKTAHVGHDLTVIGQALLTYADAVRPLQTRLNNLWVEAWAFRGLVDGNDGWNESRHLVAQHNQLITDVDAAVAAWEAAERTCANTIDTLFGGVHWVLDNLDGTHQTNEYGYTAKDLDQASHSGAGLWGKAAEHDLHWWQDGWNDWVHFHDGGHQAVIDTLVGLRDLAGLGPDGSFKASWTGLYRLSLAASPNLGLIIAANQVHSLPGTPQGTLAEYYKNNAKGLVAWDEWKHDPAKAAGAVTWTAITTVLGPKLPGVALETGLDAAKFTGRAAEATVVAAKALDLPERFRAIEWPSGDRGSINFFGREEPGEIPHGARADANPELSASDVTHPKPPDAGHHELSGSHPGSDSLHGETNSHDQPGPSDSAASPEHPDSAVEDDPRQRQTTNAHHDDSHASASNSDDADAAGPHQPDARDIAEEWPRSPLETVEPIHHPAIEWGEGKLASKAGGTEIDPYVRNLVERRGIRYLHHQTTKAITRGQVGPVVSVVFDRLTGQIYEGTNELPGTTLHPVLQERLDALDQAAAEHPDRYDYGSRTGGYPHFSDAGTHAEVKAVNQALWYRERLGYHVSHESLQSLTVDNIKPYGERSGEHPPYCQNCSVILDGTNNLAGARDSREYLIPENRRDPNDR